MMMQIYIVTVSRIVPAFFYNDVFVDVYFISGILSAFMMMIVDVHFHYKRPSTTFSLLIRYPLDRKRPSVVHLGLQANNC